MKELDKVIIWIIVDSFLLGVIITGLLILFWLSSFTKYVIPFGWETIVYIIAPLILVISLAHSVHKYLTITRKG